MYTKYIKEDIQNAQRKAKVEEEAYWKAEPTNNAPHLAMKSYYQGLEEGLKRALPLADMLEAQFDQPKTIAAEPIHKGKIFHISNENLEELKRQYKNLRDTNEHILAVSIKKTLEILGISIEGVSK